MSDHINSSTGEPGVSERSFNRWYDNAIEFGHDAEAVLSTFDRRIAEAERQELSRTVLRQIVSTEALGEIQGSEFAEDLEVVLPLQTFTRPNGQRHQGFLVYLARNNDERQPLSPVDSLIAETSDTTSTLSIPTRSRRSLTARAATQVETGAAFFDTIGAEDIEEVTQLWGPVFGWTDETVRNLSDSLAREQSHAPRERSMWFSGIRLGGQIVSLATAERISMESGAGPLDMIESTEWLVRDDPSLRGQHLMSTNLGVLNAQIAQDFDAGNHGVPLLFAECNISTRSDYAGRAAGFRIPYRSLAGLPAPQIIRQNVGVGDGIVTENPNALRDFTFVSVSRGAYNQLYGSGQASQILSAAGLER